MPKVKEITPAVKGDAFPATTQEEPNMKTKALKTMASVSDLALRTKASISNLSMKSPEKGKDKPRKKRELRPSALDLSMHNSVSRTADSSTPDLTRTSATEESGLQSPRFKSSDLYLGSRFSNYSTTNLLSHKKSTKSLRSKISTPDLRARALSTASSIKSKVATTPDRSRPRTLSSATSDPKHRSLKSKISIPNLLATITDPSHPAHFKNVCLSKKNQTLADLKRRGDIDDTVWQFTSDELQKIHERASAVFENYLRLLAVLEIKNNIHRVEAERRESYNEVLELCHSDSLVQQYNIKSTGLAIHQKAMSKANETFDEFKYKAQDSYFAVQAMHEDDDFKRVLLGAFIDLFKEGKGGSLRDVLMYYEGGETQGPEESTG